MKTGRFNRLRIAREVDFGVYLDCGDGTEILLPAKAVPEGSRIGDEVDAFVYRDSEDRLIATTEVPYAQVGEFAFLHVSQVNATGAWLDWGLPGKDLLVPYSEQKSRMRQGGDYLVYVYLDDASGRIVASARTERFLGNVLPDYRPGQEVQCLVTGETPIGYTVIVENAHAGMLYRNETFRTPEAGETLTAHVVRVRQDGKIDITLQPTGRRHTEDFSDTLLEYLKANNGRCNLGDKSPAELIADRFKVSKKTYKKAVGDLYRRRLITICDDGIQLV